MQAHKVLLVLIFAIYLGTIIGFTYIGERLKNLENLMTNPALRIECCRHEEES